MLVRRNFAVAAAAITAHLRIADASHINDEEFERRLASKAHEIFDKLTPEKIASAIPLELTLDEADELKHLRGKKHQKGRKHGKHNKKRQLKDKSTDNSASDNKNSRSVENHSQDGNSKNNRNDNSNEQSKSTTLSYVANDSDWPYAGPIQSATGRILFQFSSNQVYKCSGTVVRDETTGRSIVLTAAHCAYNDLSKEFASLAIFVPDQDGTRGSKSDFNCHNDLYGCWVLSYAVVERGWTESSFPHNVGYDYAFYVVHDRSSTHRGGYNANITGILDQDVTPMPIDFDAKLKNDFTVALGYSDENDPSFSYCSNKLDSINGIEEYTNHWLSNCAMVGGASGGPWTIDMDDSGVGTVVSVNSWGYSSTIGVAGPSLRTESGSFAECLFEKAKNATDPGRVGGYIVDC